MSGNAERCQSCGAGIESDKRWVKCECGNRVWLDKELQKKYGSSSAPRAFMPERHEIDTTDSESEDEKWRNATLDEF